MTTFAKTLAASLAVASATPSAQAAVLGFGTNPNPFTVTATAQPVPLKPNGATTVTFNTKADNTAVVVTYNAECAAVSSIVGDHVSVRIAVDGTDGQPEFDLCSALVANSQVRTAALHRAVIRVPKAGSHTVQVFAVLSEGTASGRLDDSSIVIED